MAIGVTSGVSILYGSFSTLTIRVFRANYNYTIDTNKSYVI